MTHPLMLLNSIQFLNDSEIHNAKVLNFSFSLKRRKLLLWLLTEIKEYEMTFFFQNTAHILQKYL